MRDAVQTFLTTIKEREHVLKLIEHLEMLAIRVVCEHATIKLAFHRGKAIFLEENREIAISCEVSGMAESIICLLSGEKKLRYLIIDGQLKVTASFRTILLLESIFYLTKPDEQQGRLIS